MGLFNDHLVALSDILLRYKHNQLKSPFVNDADTYCTMDFGVTP